MSGPRAPVTVAIVASVVAVLSAGVASWSLQQYRDTVCADRDISLNVLRDVLTLRQEEYATAEQRADNALFYRRALARIDESRC